MIYRESDSHKLAADAPNAQGLPGNERSTTTDRTEPQRLPLARFPLVHTRSFEEALSLQSQINSSPLRAELLDRRTPFEWRANAIAAGPIGITVGQYGAGVHGHAEDLCAMYSLVIPVEGRGVVTQHRQSGVLIPGRKAAVGSPSMPAEISFDSGYRGVQVVVPIPVLESALDALTGISRATPLRFDVAVDLEQAPAASVMRLLDFIVAEADGDGSTLSTPLVGCQLAETFVYALLLGFPHNHSRLLNRSAPRVEPAYLRRAEEYIVANAREPVAMRDLVAAAGVSAGALFTAFRAHRGCSPMAFLRARRFELARTRLLSSPGNSVAEIALSCGLEHLGRFSVEYKKRFGESPNQTLQRARGAVRR